MYNAKQSLNSEPGHRTRLIGMDYPIPPARS